VHCQQQWNIFCNADRHEDTKTLAYGTAGGIVVIRVGGTRWVWGRKGVREGGKGKEREEVKRCSSGRVGGGVQTEF